MNSGRVLARLSSGRDLSRKESYEIFLRLFAGRLDPRSGKSLLLLLARKGETAGEILGCLDALTELEPPLDTGIKGLIDTCGTGGDGSQSINVSTLAAIVVAGAGGKVAKHGNRAITSKAGSSDLMEACGVKLDAGKAAMLEAIRRHGIGYFHAPFYHPVFSRMHELRKSLAARTIFNYLGPLSNPLLLDGQVLGVVRREYLELYAGILASRKIRRAIVCRSRDGMDEISLCSPTDAILVEKSKMRKFTIDPERYGLGRGKKSDAAGGTPAVNHRLAMKILRGNAGKPLEDLIVINAAAGLFAGGLAKSIAQGVVQARRSIRNGNALAALNGLVRTSRGDRR